MTATATSKITKRVRELAATSYDEYGRCKLQSETFGCYRRVIVENGVAYKLANDKEYAGHNRTEWNLYYRLSPSARNLMAKPLAISSCGLVMAIELIPTTVARSPHHTYRDGDIFNRHLRDILSAEGLAPAYVQELIADNHNNNIGVRASGELCWIDWANWGKG